jgi:hypothetical protein
MIQNNRKSLSCEFKSAESILHKDTERFFLGAANRAIELREDLNRVQIGAKMPKDKQENRMAARKSE